MITHKHRTSSYNISRNRTYYKLFILKKATFYKKITTAPQKNDLRRSRLYRTTGSQQTGKEFAIVRLEDYIMSMTVLSTGV